jgi:WD40 repeat protein/transcriptional regulator with XRE-family HTH domain
VAAQPAPKFAGLLQQLRAEAGLTQEELAEAAGLSPRTISDLERGVHRLAQQDTARLLADALGLDGQVRGLFLAAARGQVPAAEVLAARSGLRGSVDNDTGHQADVERPPRVVTSSPYRGLAAFEEKDAGFFCGREAATAQVLGRLARMVTGTGLLVVSGASGAGKSSLLRAGVVAQLRKSGLAGAPEAAAWPYLVFTPTRAPLDELALRMGLLARVDAASVRRGLEADPAGFALTARQAALMRPPASAEVLEGSATGQGQRRVLLVVDQFEELFTLCPDEGQRRGFITALHAAVTPGHGPDQAVAALVVLGVRADFQARCAEYRQLAGAVQDRYLLTAMTERQLRMAITEPAKKAGSAVDADLVEVLLAEARAGQCDGSVAGVLPFVSHALDQAWQLHADGTLTLADYERVGGVEAAVATGAYRAYEHLPPARQAAARQVFMRLAAPNGDGIDAAERVTRVELTDGKSAPEARDVAEVLEAFAAERLLTLEADTVAISHRVLLTAWPLLRDTWLAGTRGDRIVRDRLRHAAAEWAGRSRDPSYLYLGSLLSAAAGAAARISGAPAHHPPLSQTEREFLDASGRADRYRTRRRHVLLAFLIALAMALAAVGVLAVRVVYQAAHQGDVAISQQLISQSLLLGPADPALSKLLSVEAWRLNPSDDARYAMLAAATLPDIAVIARRTGPVAFSSNGDLLATDDVKGSLWLWDVANSRPAGPPFTGLAGLVLSAGFSPRGDLLAAGTSAGITRLWNATTRLPIGGPLTSHDGTVLSVAFNPGGTILATGNSDGTVRLWDVATRRPVAAFYGHGAINSVAFSPQGSTLAAGSEDGTVRLWDVATRRPVAVLNGHAGFVLSVAFSPQGSTLAAGTENGTVRLWDVATRRPVAVLNGHAGLVWSVAFAPHGNTLATGSADDTVRLWDVSAGGSSKRSIAGSPGSAIAQHICAAVGRSLTRAQWAQYVPGREYQRVCP